MEALNMEAILFDLDGTLIDSDRAVFSALVQGLNFLHIPFQKNITSEQAMKFSGRGLPDIVNAFVDQPYRTKETIEKIYKTIPHIYNREFFEKEVFVYEGINEVLERIKTKGLPLAVISNSTQQVVDELCACFFDGIFDFKYGDRGENRTKPDPVGILAALDVFNVCPDKALYIGDTMVDVLTAQAAGVPMAGAMWGKSDATDILRKSKCCPVVELPSDIMQYISQSETI